MVRIDVGGGGTLIAHSKCPGAMLCEATESLWDLTLMLDGHGGLAADAAGVLWHSCQEDDVVDYVAHLTWPALLSADQEAPDVRPEWPASGGPAYGVPFLPWELARLAASEPVNQGELLSGIRFVPDGAPPVVHRWLDAGAGGATMGEFFAFESWDAVGGHTLAIQAGPQGLSDGAGNVATGVLSELSVLGVGEPVAGCDFDGPASIGYWGPVSFAAPGSSEAAELCEQGGCAVLGPLELNPCGPMAPKGAGIALRIATGGAKSVRVRYRGQSTPGEQSTVDFGLVYPLTDDGMIKGALASVEPVPEWADAILPVQDGQIEAGLVIAPHVYWCFPPPPPSITATVVIDRIVVE
ncbi:MAG: hypothetical protein HY744_18970 [Deltaproteobacteria bacterium]|nr:hypothetical protein [Deltaproteobacteria bacterium]